jgi:prolyl 4-hydroxylase
MTEDVTPAEVAMLLSHGRYSDAARLLITAAASGSSQACVMLARWRITGDIIRRDLPAARSLLGRAAALGDPEAALLHGSFLAAGVGGHEDWHSAVTAITSLRNKHPRSEEQLRLIGKMKLDEYGFPATSSSYRVLAEAPMIAVFDCFATAAECAYLRDRLSPALQPSVVIDPATGRLIPHPIRSSDGAAFGVFDEDLVVNAINRRIATASKTLASQGEPLQMLRYRPGGEYRAHLDALPRGDNQRILTFILYLSDRYTGGETNFPRRDLSFRGRTGDAILFGNVTAEGRPDPLALHAGLPVTRGEKLIVTRWIREDAFTYPSPSPLLNI